MERILRSILACLLILAIVSGCDGSGSGTTTATDPLDTPISETGSIRMGAVIDGVFESGRIGLSIDDDETLASGAAITCTVLIIDGEGNPYPIPTDMTFSSTFSDLGLAEIEANKTAINGSATVVYKAKGGSGTDTVTATAVIDDVTLSAFAALDLEGGASGHLSFVSAQPKYLALNNTGGPSRSETSLLVFKVTDINGDPVYDQVVDFALSTEIGGLYLSADSAVSGPSGLVQTVVNSGTVSTEVKVQATIQDSDPVITVVSDTLVISTGLADQNSMTIAPETINVEGWRYVNVEVPVTVVLADHFNNFVPDGTMVYLTTELGAIDESCEIVDGECVAIWRSGNPDESDCDNDPVPCWPGIATISAFLIGEESFFDRNSNGHYDSEDKFDLSSDVPPDVFRDDNWGPGYWNETRQDSEPYWDFNGNNMYDGNANGIYNGSLCSDAAELAGLCSKELVYVRQQTQIVVSGSFVDIFTLAPATLDLTGQPSGVVTITIRDLNGNPLPAGSTVKLEITNGELLLGNTFEIPNTSSDVDYSVIIVPSEGDGAQGYLYATVTTPFDNVTVSSNGVTIIDND